jgi:acetyltransferase
MADVDFGDMLDYLAAEPATRAILLSVEAITHARKFMSAGALRRAPSPCLWSRSGALPKGPARRPRTRQRWLALT